MKSQLYPALAGTIGYILDTLPAPSATRQDPLLQLAAYIRDNPGSANLLFVCTHNSRRSHLAQYWAAAAAAYYDIPGIGTYSGGTEATALHLHTIDALLESSFEVRIVEKHPDNPRYEILLGGHISSIAGFSKKIDTPPNPSSNFCAVMVCSDADENCPFVPGAAKRISLPFEDPKISDDKPERRKVYHARSLQIGRELLWAFEQATT